MIFELGSSGQILFQLLFNLNCFNFEFINPQMNIFCICCGEIDRTSVKSTLTTMLYYLTMLACLLVDTRCTQVKTEGRRVVGNGCGPVFSAVAADNRGLMFESSHQ